MITRGQARTEICQKRTKKYNRKSKNDQKKQGAKFPSTVHKLDRKDEIFCTIFAFLGRGGEDREDNITQHFLPLNPEASASAETNRTSEKTRLSSKDVVHRNRRARRIMPNPFHFSHVARFRPSPWESELS